ncbi:MAG: PAS domain S-box protein, partial [Thermoanaerobaculia bacterium]|nr:PAS domain S-box protein [Thermoanaerobaculia bacterium]
MNEVHKSELPGRDSEETLRYFLGFEELVTSISTQLIDLSAADTDSLIEDALGKIGEFAGVDRSYVFRLSHERETMTNTHEWCAPGIEPQIENLQELPLDLLPWLMERLNRLESIPISSVRDLPEEASAEKEIFESQDIRSIILVPMVFDQELYGFLGFDAVRTSKVWPERTIALLRIVGEMIVNALERTRAERELRESEQRHRQLVELMPDLVLLHEDGEIRFVNSAGARLLEASSPDELFGRPILSIVHPEDREGASRRIEEILDAEKTVEGVTERFVTARGREVIVEVSATRFPAEGERAVLVVARDVGEQYRATREVERSVSLLQATLESTADGILVVDLDGEIQTYNQRVAQIWKIDEEILASGDDGEILKVALRSVRDREQFSETWRELHNDPHAVTRRLLEMNDGRIIEQFTMPQLLDGQPVGRVWSFRDVTEQRRTEEALLDSVERYRLLFERNLAGVYRNTIEGEFIDCNEACARILGYSSRDELMGMNAIEAYYDPADRDIYVENLLERGVVTNTEVCLKKKDGSPVWVLENATLLDAPEGEMPTVEGTLIDISEIKRAEALLQESEERYRLMAQYSTDMIARLTPDWIFMYVSPASSAILGYTPNDLIGRSIEELIHPDDRST